MRSGFTLIELIVVLGVSTVLLAVTSINLLTPQRRVVKTGTIEQVVADIRSQQNKAMVGDGTGSSFGVHFDDSSYVLFTGLVYNDADTSNFVVNLNNNIAVSSTFAGNNIVFSPVSGEVSSYVSGADVITVVDVTDNSAHNLHVNKYGVVDSEN